MNFLNKAIGVGSPFDKVFTKVEHFIVMFAGFSGLIVMFVNIAMRYLAQHSIVWAEEYARYMLIIIVYFGASMAVQRRAMLKVEILSSIVPKLKAFEETVEVVMGIAVMGLLITFGAQFINFIMPFGEKSAAMNWLPMWIVYLIMPIGCGFIAFRYIQRGLLLVCGKKGLEKEAK